MCRPLAVLILLTALPALAADPKPPDYYPLADKNRWDYRVDVGGMKVEVACELRADDRDKKTVYVLESRIGTTTTREDLYANAAGVYRTAFNGQSVSQPLKVIGYPVRPEAWADKVKVGEVEVEFKMTSGAPVEVTVPAGTYRAIPVKLEASFGAQKVTGTTWYAENVGIVKQTTVLGKVEVQMELLKFTPGK